MKLDLKAVENFIPVSLVGYRFFPALLIHLLENLQDTLLALFVDYSFVRP